MPGGRVVAAYDKALAEGVDAVTFNGRTIDMPAVEREESIAAWEARRRRMAKHITSSFGN